MYSKLEFALHGLIALLFLPWLCLKQWLCGERVGECGSECEPALQKKNLTGYVSVVTGKQWSGVVADISIDDFIR